jgi:2Fe-2S ferredoxin
VQITYIEDNGTRRTVDVPENLSVMEGAIRHSIPGIEGDCGGNGACGTCHVYVAPEWLHRLPPMDELERAMLDFVVDPHRNSRLACQIVLTPELEGLVVRTPERQF